MGYPLISGKNQRLGMICRVSTKTSSGGLTKEASIFHSLLLDVESNQFPVFSVCILISPRSLAVDDSKSASTLSILNDRGAYGAYGSGFTWRDCTLSQHLCMSSTRRISWNRVNPDTACAGYWARQTSSRSVLSISFCAENSWRPMVMSWSTV